MQSLLFVVSGLLGKLARICFQWVAGFSALFLAADGSWGSAALSFISLYVLSYVLVIASGLVSDLIFKMIE